MKNPTPVLMVDDHPMIIEGYKNVLLQVPDLKMHIDSANDCTTALSQLEASQDEPYEIIFLDIRIPPCPDGKILSGEELGIFIRQNYPPTKIIMLTMFNERVRLANILDKVKPDAFLIKSEVTPNELKEAVQAVLNDKIYYSKTIENYFSSPSLIHNTLDDYDIRILYYLSKGTKTKDLVNNVPLSLGAIEKRKRRIKEVFGINNGGDKELLDKAREYGFL